MCWELRSWALRAKLVIEYLVVKTLHKLIRFVFPKVYEMTAVIVKYYMSLYYFNESGPNCIFFSRKYNPEFYVITCNFLFY